MSSFYGDTTRLPMTPFQFDKIYTSKEEMDNNAETDGVFLNRYVLLQKKNNNGETYGEVYQKQFNEETKFYQYSLIASLTAPFTIGEINTDFNINNNYKEISNGQSTEKNNANWITNDSQNYLLNLSIPELGNALIDIYNSLAGLDTKAGDTRKFNIIELSGGIPEEASISLWEYPYHLAHEAGVYYVIMPKFIEIDINNEDYFNQHRQDNIPIFLYGTNELYFGNYDDSKKYSAYSYSDQDFNLIPLSDFSNNIYGLIGYLNKLKDGEYRYDRNSLQGCIDYANQIINQMQILTNLKEISLTDDLNTNGINGVNIEQKISYTTLSNGVEENKDDSLNYAFQGYNGISVEIPSDKSLRQIEFKIPKQNYKKYNKKDTLYRDCCPINYSISYTPLSYKESTKKAFEIYGCYTIEEYALQYEWQVGKKEEISINTLLNQRLTYPQQVENINIEYFSTSSSGEEYLYNIHSYIKNNTLNLVRIDSSTYYLYDNDLVSLSDIYVYFHIKGTCEEG